MWDQERYLIDILPEWIIMLIGGKKIIERVFRRSK